MSLAPGAMHRLLSDGHWHLLPSHPSRQLQTPQSHVPRPPHSIPSLYRSFRISYNRLIMLIKFCFNFNNTVSITMSILFRKGYTRRSAHCTPYRSCKYHKCILLCSSRPPCYCREYIITCFQSENSHRSCKSLLQKHFLLNSL